MPPLALPSSDIIERRGKTAMKRHRCSKPVALALADGLISPERSFFDHGCGHGADIRFLEKQKIRATGWDPAHRPNGDLDVADVVNLGYVLNVIETPAERHQTLLEAFSLARKVLIVAVRVDSSLAEADEEGDGLLTSRGTFQKIFTQQELRDTLQTVLERRPYVAALGVAYVFKDESLEAAYVANRTFTRRLEYRTDLVEAFAKSPVAQQYVGRANALGRLPLPEEFKAYPALLEAFGSPQRIARLALRQIDPVAWEGSRTQRREDILTYFASLRLSRLRPPPLGRLPATIRGDIKALWGSYAKAREAGEAFLFTLGNPDAVKAACAAAPIGKRLPGDLYIHRSSEEELPALLRVVVFAAKQIVGELPYDLIKIKENGRAVSFLMYEDFERVAHPALRAAVRVYLPKATYQIRDYRESPNPPILHRKDSLVGPAYPALAQFQALTQAEDAVGLLGGNRIGHRQQWETLLEEAGYTIEGHTLVRSHTSDTPTEANSPPSEPGGEASELAELENSDGTQPATDEEVIEAFIDGWDVEPDEQPLAREIAEVLYRCFLAFRASGLKQRTLQTHLKNLWTIGFLTYRVAGEGAEIPDCYRGEPRWEMILKLTSGASKHALKSYRATWRKLGKFVAQAYPHDEEGD